MRWKKAKAGDVKEWHRWFAWFPVEVEEGEVAWLEWVCRRGYFTEDFNWIYAYHLMPCKEKDYE